MFQFQWGVRDLDFYQNKEVFKEICKRRKLRNVELPLVLVKHWKIHWNLI